MKVGTFTSLIAIAIAATITLPLNINAAPATVNEARSDTPLSVAERVYQNKQAHNANRRAVTLNEMENIIRRADSERADSDKYKGQPYPAGVEPTAGCTECKSSLSFAGAAAKKYAVGTQIPSLPFKTKNSWAGNIPITGTTVQNASLFFWLWGKDATDSGDDLVIWLNGGPGCSSLEGMLQENGPFLYLNKNDKPFANGYSFTRAANVLYVEQPVNTGFTTGTTQNTNEDQVAAQFASFLANFYKTFPELAKKKLWITGESYAGTYIPYISSYLYSKGQTPQLQGGIIIDGSITDQRLQEDVVVYQYAVQHQKELNFTNDDLAQIKAESDKCDLTTFVDKNLKYPPSGRLPNYSSTCQPFNTYYDLANQRNPQFNIYNIDTPTPDPNSPLGFPNSGDEQYLHKTFFDNYDLQTYIHAPHKKWVECATVFVGGDRSKKPDRQPDFNHSILATTIEKSKNFIIMNGNLDGLLITNGTSLALQNLTWNNAQGFSKAPLTPLYDQEGNQKAISTTERGLSYAVVPGAGHMIPADQPSFALKALLHLTGQADWTQK